MKRLLIAVAAILTSTQALAMACDLQEYAEVKDHASTPKGRRLLAVDYCVATTMQYTSSTRRDEAQCGTMRTRIIDALKAAEDQQAIDYAMSGCKGKPYSLPTDVNPMR